MRIPVPRGPQVWDWSSPDGMIVWLAARLEEVERSVPPGDGQGIVQQILENELPKLREMLAALGVPRQRFGPGEVCTCGHTLGCDCRQCSLCVPPEAS